MSDHGRKYSQFVIFGVNAEVNSLPMNDGSEAGDAAAFARGSNAPRSLIEKAPRLSLVR
jgi:hypothetical protein